MGHDAGGQFTMAGEEHMPAPLQVEAGMKVVLVGHDAGAHGIAAGVEQTPALQVEAGIRDRRSAEQLAVAHGTGDGGVQVPVPLHVPTPILEVMSIEQVGAPHISPAWVWQAVPFGRHRAMVPQACSAQVVMQQTFFVPLLMQMPLEQSLGLVQSEPRPSGSLHSPPMHV